MAGQIFATWAVLQLLGLAGLPLTAWLLRALPDRGYAFAKTLGLLLTGYFAWLAAMLGLAPFGAGSLVGAALLTLGLGVWALGGPKDALAAARAGLRAGWPTLLAAEALFLGAMLAVVWMRAHDPTPWGTERPMDFAFFNAIQRSPSFPPGDPWLAGYSINYYYFGYLLMGAVALLSGNPPAVAYNLALATLFALTALGVAGMIGNLIRMSLQREQGTGGRGQPDAEGGPPSSGATVPSSLSPVPFRMPWLFPLLGVVFVLVAGNQSGALQVLLGDERVVALDTGQLLSAIGQAARGEPFITLPTPAPTGEFGVIESWQRQDRTADFNWWWSSRSLWDEYPLNDPSRPELTAERRYTITEFPLFSFRLGDMHPHVMALPFGLLAAALACNTLAGATAPRFGRGRAGWGELALSGIVVGSLYVINSWDLPTYLLLFAAALALLLLRLEHDRPWWELARLLLLLAAAAYLLFLPFHLTFRSLVGGAQPWLDLPLLGRITSIIGVYPAARSGLHAFLIIFGLFALPITAFVYLAARSGQAGGPTVVPQALPAGGEAGSTPSYLVARAAGLDQGLLSTRHLPWIPPALLLAGLLLGFPLLALAALGALALERAWRLRDRPAECFALLLAALGCAVVFGTELVYIRDTFEGWSTRFNTIFKFYYQVWLLWGLLAPFALWWALRYTAGPRRALALGTAALTCTLLAGALVYPWLTLGELGRGETIGLNGRTPRELSPAGEASIAWLRVEAPAGSVVLEAPDLLNAADVAAAGAPPNCEGAYNGAGFAGVSAATGLPTVLGWEGHQRQWRGGDPAVLDLLQPRCDDVDAAFRTADAARAREILAKYDVDYVYIGGLEQQLYGPESLGKFAQLGEPVFQQDEVTIYRVQ